MVVPHLIGLRGVSFPKVGEEIENADFIGCRFPIMLRDLKNLHPIINIYREYEVVILDEDKN